MSTGTPDPPVACSWPSLDRRDRQGYPVPSRPLLSSCCRVPSCSSSLLLMLIRPQGVGLSAALYLDRPVLLDVLPRLSLDLFLALAFPSGYSLRELPRRDPRPLHSLIVLAEQPCDL